MLAALVSHVSGKLPPKEFWKISICVNSINQQQHMKVVGGVLRYNIKVDTEQFASLQVADQKSMMLELICSTLSMIFSEIYGIADRLDGFAKAFLSRSCENVFSGPAASFNEMKAFVRCHQGFADAKVYMVILNDSSEERKYLLNVVSPEEFIFNIYLNKPKWVNSSEVMLIASNGEVRSVVLE